MKKLLFGLFCVIAANAQIVSMSLGAPVFSGSGLNDASVTGSYVGLRANHNYTITVAAAGGTDTFNSQRDGVAPIGPFAMTTSPQPLYYGAGFITGASWSAGVVTFTDVGHALATGALVSVGGASPAGYNVTLLLATVIDSSHFSVPVASNPGTWTSGGVATRNDGLSVQWAATTGHTAGATWSIRVLGTASPPTFLAPAVGAQARNQQAKMAETFSIEDFGASQASADNSTAIQLCMANSIDQRASCYCPPGMWNFSSPQVFTTGQPTLRGNTNQGSGSCTLVYTGSSSSVPWTFGNCANTLMPMFSVDLTNITLTVANGLTVPVLLQACGVLQGDWTGLILGGNSTNGYATTAMVRFYDSSEITLQNFLCSESAYHAGTACVLFDDYGNFGNALITVSGSASAIFMFQYAVVCKSCINVGFRDV